MRIALLGLALLFSAGCARSTAPAVEYPGTLRNPGEIAWNFFARQTIDAEARDRSGRFDAVLQKNGEELLLLALTPYGSRAFLLRQRGDDVTFERFVRRELPFPPRFILLDVHRAFFSGLPNGPRTDGVHEARIDDELVRERWREGRLYERRFRRITGSPAGEILVRYEGGMIPGSALPSRIVFENGWYGYRLTIVTTEYRPLP